MKKDGMDMVVFFAKKEKYISKQELLILLSENKINSLGQYLNFRKSRINLPYDYKRVYNVGSFHELIGLQPEIIPDYKEAQRLCKINGVKNQKEYHLTCKMLNLPYHPDRYYKNSGWKNWKDFLDTNYFAFEEAKRFASTLGLSDFKDWNKYKNASRFNRRFPKNPNQVYKNKGWKGWADFLGK